MTDNETNLAKWTAFARSTDPEAVGHTLNELAGEIGRLRGVCVDASKRAREMASGWGIDKRNKVRVIADDLANEGSKDGK
jgi:hypothetical protein